mgnify:CR=1 FL=1
MTSAVGLGHASITTSLAPLSFRPREICTMTITWVGTGLPLLGLEQDYRYLGWNRITAPNNYKIAFCKFTRIRPIAPPATPIQLFWTSSVQIFAAYRDDRIE